MQHETAHTEEAEHFHKRTTDDCCPRSPEEPSLSSTALHTLHVQGSTCCHERTRGRPCGSTAARWAMHCVRKHSKYPIHFTTDSIKDITSHFSEQYQVSHSTLKATDTIGKPQRRLPRNREAMHYCPLFRRLPCASGCVVDGTLKSSSEHTRDRAIAVCLKKNRATQSLKR